MTFIEEYNKYFESESNKTQIHLFNYAADQIIKELEDEISSIELNKDFEQYKALESQLIELGVKITNNLNSAGDSASAIMQSLYMLNLSLNERLDLANKVKSLIWDADRALCLKNDPYAEIRKRSSVSHARDIAMVPTRDELMRNL